MSVYLGLFFGEEMIPTVTFVIGFILGYALWEVVRWVDDYVEKEE